MTTLTSVLMPVVSLRAGDVIRYGGGEFVVAEVLPAAVLSGDVVVGIAPDGVRVALIYANAESAAELVHSGGA